MDPMTHLNEPHREGRVIVPALLLILIIVGGYIWFRSSRGDMNDASKQGVGATAPQTVSVTEGVATDSSIAGFPSETPIERGRIIENYKASYSKLHATQYTISYSSSRLKDENWIMYSNFLNQEGFTLDPMITDKSNGFVTGNKDGDTFSVVISKSGEGSLVQLNFLDR